MASALRRYRTHAIVVALLFAAGTGILVHGQAEATNSAAPEMVLQFGHAGAIAKLTPSADGRQLLSIGLDYTIRLWDLASGTLLRTMAEGRGESFRTAYFQKAEQPMVVGLTQKDLKIRDLASGQAALTMAAPSAITVNFVDYPNVAVSADHGTIAVIGSPPDGPITLYSTKTGSVITSFDITGVRGSTCLSLNADGSLLAHARMESFGGTVSGTVVWDVKSHRKLYELPDANGSVHAKLAPCPEFTADGQFLVIAGRLDGIVRFWDVRTGQARKAFESGFKAPSSNAVNSCSQPCISALALSADGQRLAIGTGDGTVSLRDVKTGQEIRHVQDKGAIYAVALGPAGEWLAYGGDNYDIKVLDVKSGRNRVLSTNPDLVQTVACSTAANSCAFGTLDKRIRLWNFTTQRETILSFNTSQVNALAFSDDGRWLVSGGGDKAVKVYEPAAGGAARTFSGHARAVTAVAMSGNGQFVASVDVGGALKLWSRETGKELPTLAGSVRTEKRNNAGSLGVTGVHFRKTGDLAVSYEDGEVRVLDLASGMARSTTHIKGSPQVLSPDDRWILDLDYGGIAIWNVADGSLVRRLAHGVGALESAAFSPDGRWLATGSADTTIKLWDTQTWKESTLRGHQGFVKSLAFGPDGRRLVSGSGDGTVRVWDVASGKLLAVVASQKGGQPSVVVSPTGLFDGTADSEQQVAWRIPNTLDVAPLDAFFTDFFRPGLFGELMAGGDPAPEVDFAAVLQVPGLRTMLAQKQAHIETRNTRVLVCFAEPPRVAADVPVTEQQLLPRVVGGFRIDPQDRTCPYQKELALSGSDPAVTARRLTDWKPASVSTAWDGKRSTATSGATLHVFVAGVSAYPADSGFDHLPYAASSARAIEAVFRAQSRQLSPYTAVRVWDGLYEAAATHDAIRQRFAEMARVVKDDDVVLLYLAGHGVVSSGQEMFYFVPIDGRDSDLRHTGVSTALLADGIRALDARRVVLFIDACQSGGAVEPLEQIAAVKAQVETRRAQVERQTPGHEHGVGVHIIAATLPLSYAVQVTNEQSALAATTLAALQQGPEVTVRQISTYVSQHLADASARVAAGFRQVPLIDEVGLDFPIARK